MKTTSFYWPAAAAALVVAINGAAEHWYFGAICWGMAAFFLALAAEIYRQ